MAHKVKQEADQERALAETDKVLIVVTTADTDRVLAAISIACGARLAGKAADLMFTASGVTALCTDCMPDVEIELADEPGRRVAEDVAVSPAAPVVASALLKEGLAGLGLPDTAALLTKFKDAGGYVYVSKPAMDELGIIRANLWGGVKDTLALSAFYHHATPATQFLFL